MNKKAADMIPDENTHLLDELQSLLEKQIELARQGNPAGKQVELLSEQAGHLVGKIAQARTLELPESKNRREQLQKLYEGLCLVLTAQKADMTAKLSQIRKGKKTIGTYRANI